MPSSENLAITGGPKSVTNAIRPWPIANEAIESSVKQALNSGQWGKYDGELTEQLIDKLQTRFRREHCLLGSSGTIAVELALRGVGVKAGDEVIMAAYDFPGNFRAVEAIGAKPVLVDVVSNGWNLETDQLQEAISDLTSGILVSHLHGNLADIDHIATLATETSDSKIPIIEDACQVPGAVFGNQPAGSFGDVSVFSFGGSKLLSAGRGGAILANDESIIQRAKIFAHRGNDAFPLSQLQAAALLPQLDQIDELNNQRNVAASSLLKLTADQTLLVPHRISDSFEESNEITQTAYYKMAWLIDSSKCSRESFIAAVKAEGVPMDVGFRGFAKRSPRRCRKIGTLSSAKTAAENTVLLHHPVLLESEETIQQVANGILKVSIAASKGQL